MVSSSALVIFLLAVVVQGLPHVRVTQRDSVQKQHQNAQDDDHRQQPDVVSSLVQTTSDGSTQQDESDALSRHDSNSNSNSNTAALSHGVSFSRSITEVAEGSLIKMTTNDAESRCTSHDEYGDNDCSYSWSEVIELTLESSLGVDLVEGDLIVGDFVIDIFEKLHFSCSVCGKPCVIYIPRVNKQVSVETPPCPVKAQDFTYTFVQQLPGREILPPVIGTGHLTLQREDGTVMIKVYTKVQVLT